MTLIELLIVIVILTTLVAAAIPLMSPTTDARRIREAARGLSTYISTTQSKTVRTNRPHGVYFKRLSEVTGNAGDNGACIEVFEVEQPAPFAGYSEGSAARVALYNPSNLGWYNGIRPLVLIQFVTNGTLNPRTTDGMPAEWDADSIPPYLIRPGDIIEIGGTRYELVADINDTVIVPQFVGANNEFFGPDTGKAGGNPARATLIVGRPINGDGRQLQISHDDLGNAVGSAVTLNPPYFTYPAKYKILRQPTLTSTEPFQLPDGTAIDMAGSGAPIRVQTGAGLPLMTGSCYTPPDSSGNYDVANPIDNTAGVIIMFTPEGSIERLRIVLSPGSAQLFDEPITDNFYLLVGLSDNLPLENPDFYNKYNALTPEEREGGKAKFNWLNLESHWVVINSQGGNVATVENAAVYQEPIGSITFSLSTETAQRRANEINKARDFAREMTRTGGR